MKQSSIPHTPAPAKHVTIHRLSYSNNPELSLFFDKYKYDVLTENVFNSKMWYQGWLNSTSAPLHAIEFRLNKAEIIGIALFSLAHLKPHIARFVRASLNQANDEKSDQCWIEYNNIHCSADYLEACSKALLEYVFQELKASEFYISMAFDIEHWKSNAKDAQLTFESEPVPGFKTDLQSVKNIDNLLSLFSSNTRSQIRRSIKKIESDFGPITTENAPDNKKWSSLSALSKLHRKQWSESREGSGFDNANFLAHHKFMVTHFSNNIAILTVCAGEHLIGSGYFLLSKDTAFFYCSGLALNNKHKHVKPGYIFHTMAMLYFAEKGLKTYDFLGGDYQYKQSLSTQKYYFHHVTIYNNSLNALFLKTLKAIKRHITKFIEQKF